MAADGGAGGSLHDEDGWSGRALSDTISTQPQLPMPTTPVISASPGSAGPDRERASYGPTRAIRAKRNGPYDRPTAGRHAAAGPQAAAIVRTDAARALTRSRRPWLGSGLSKIISNGATYLYASVFGRRLQPPLQITNGDTQDGNESEQILSPSVGTDDVQVRNGQSGRVENAREPDADTASLSEVEDLLKRKTLSRDEFQRLSLLLLSRVTGNGVDTSQQPTQVESDVISSRLEGRPLGGNQSEAQRWRQDLRKSREERDNGVQTITLYDSGRPSTTLGGASEKTDALGSSPVEVARAFMGGRPSPHIGSSPTEPSNPLDINRVSSGPRRSAHTPQTAIIKRAATEAWNENQFRTPPPPSASPWNRSRVLSRTPYSRPLRQNPPREKVVDGTFGSPVATRWTPIRTPVTGGREMLKRRSAVLDEGWSSGGPIRRTRQKAIVPVTPSSLGQPRRSDFAVTPAIGSSVATPISSIAGKLSPRTGDAAPRKEKELLTQSGHFYVPAQSSETARRILETLDRMTPSPKGKALEEELARVRDKPPSTLTEGMLNDQARKSMRFAEFSLPSLPNESREPGPSRSTVQVSPAFGSAESTFKLSESVAKAKGKGKAVPPSENGPSVLGGSESNHERLSMAEGGPVKLLPVRPKDADAVIIPEGGRGTGFRMNAVFEESGSEDEGRVTQANPLAPPSVSISKVPIATSKSTTAMPSVFGAGPLSPPSTPVVGLSSFPRSTTAADALGTVSSGFTFPTRAPLECPPTPKAMSPMSNSPKATLPAPLSQFGQLAEPAAPSRPAVELHKIAGENANSQPESKAEFSFGSATAPVVSVAQTAPAFPAPLDPGVANAFKQSSPFPFSVAPPSFSSAPNPISGTIQFPPVSLKAGGKPVVSADPLLPPVSTSAFKMGAVFPNASPFPSSTSASLFGSGSSSAQSASGVAPPSMSISPSTSSGSGSAAMTSFFASTGGGGSVPAGSSGFGQVPAFAGFKISSTAAGPLVSPQFQESGGKDSGSTDLLDAERPQKRTISQQREPSKPQEPVVTMPSHSFTAFGTNIGSTAPSKAETVTFAATGAPTTTSASLFALSSFGQASTSAQQTSPLPPTGSVPFTFGTPASSAGNISTSSAPAAGFGNNPSFPSFTSPSFGGASSGSKFGDSQASPMTFASTSAPSAFGSASANPVFGRFSSEAGSQSPSMPVFGSGFSVPARSTTPPFPSFGASSSPSFAFGNATNSPSEPPFGFAFGKAPASSQPSTLFGLSGSATPVAFGASPTTNGTMASDVVNDHSNMDDNSMAEEPSSQMGGSLSSEPAIFGAQASGTGPYVFGSQTGGPGAAAPNVFGGFQAPSNTGLATAAAGNPFAAPQPAGSLDFAGGSFTLGSGGDRPATRKFIKAKRTGAKRGK